MHPNDKFMIHYSEGRGSNLGKARNMTRGWRLFRKGFSAPSKSGERFSQYKKMPVDQQVALKGADGWIYRTHVEAGKRRAGTGKPTDLVTLDFDYATPAFLEDLELGLVMPEWEYFVHSSRNHTSESPRLRMFLLLDEPVDNDTYPALSRIVAQHFDPDMSMVDKVSFRRAQMMFKPTTSVDGDWFFYHNPGERLDPLLILDEFTRTVGDWHDLSNLPRVPDEELRDTSAKAEDPTHKPGPVGDFCRAYNVVEAIDKFLPDLYVPVDAYSEKPRYTYTGGSTSSGAVVEDDGLFLYSHHGTDPCSDKLVNAFDLVRIHLFGNEDDKTDPDTAPSKVPSYKSMLKKIGSDRLYKEQQASTNYDTLAMFDEAFDGDIEIVEEEEDEDFGEDEQYIEDLVGSPSAVNGSAVDDLLEDLVGTPTKTIKVALHKRDKNFIKSLELDKAGKIVSSLANIGQILLNDPRFCYSIGYNNFTKSLVKRSPFRLKNPAISQRPLGDKINGDPWEDFLDTQIRFILEGEAGPGQAGYGLKVTDRDLAGAINLVGQIEQFHPIRDYMEEQVWDGVERAETLFIDYLGAEDTPYHRETARLWLMGAVARVYEPGHKFDFVPILEGGQGRSKSSFINTLAMSWYGELNASFSSNRDLLESMEGCWILEIPELASLRRSEIEDVKAFISGKQTRGRKAYARHAETVQRQCVFMGSVNDDEYLVDRTGNRRWWPIRVSNDKPIDLAKLRRNLTQIWAEATHLFKEVRAANMDLPDAPLFIQDDSIRVEAEQIQRAREIQSETDFYSEEIAPWLTTPLPADPLDPESEKVFHERVTLAECWKLGLGHEKDPTQTQLRHLGAALRAHGWTSTSPRRPTKAEQEQDGSTPEKRIRYYVPPPGWLEAVQENYRTDPSEEFGSPDELV